MNVRSATTTILIGLLATSQTMAAKPTPPPPPPPPPPQTCPVQTGVAFPALVYSKDKYKTVKKFGGSQVYDGSDLYIANSTATCSILIFPGTRESSAGSFSSYRQIGTEGRIAYPDGSQIKLLIFHMNTAGGIVEPLPLSPLVVYRTSVTPYSVNDVELSPDGQTIYFTEYSPADKHWQDTLKSIDLSSCTANCTPQVLHTFALDNGVAWLSVSTANDRLFMSIHDRVPDIRTISFLQKAAGVWSSLRHVISHRDDQSYSDIRGFGSTAWAQWDYDSSTVPNDVVAYTVERSSGNTRRSST